MPIPTKQLSEEHNKFLIWLLQKDINENSNLYGILTPEESDFLAEVLKLGFYDMEERVEINKILNKYDEKITKQWTNHNKKSEYTGFTKESQWRNHWKDKNNLTLIK